MQRLTATAVIGLAALLARPGAACAGGAAVIEHDGDAMVTRVTVEACDGKVSLPAVVRGLARARGFDEAALDGLLPEMTVRVDTFFGRATLALWNQALPEGMYFRVRSPAAPGGERRLTLHVRDDLVLSSTTRLRKLLRRTVVRLGQNFWKDATRDFGLTVPAGNPPRPGHPDPVVFVHGFQSASWPDPLTNFLQAEGFAVAHFNYPNDQPIMESARLLSRALRDYAAAHPGQRVRLVAHSMGGLVARAVLEDPALDPGNVVQLVMVATPNQGSRMATFGFALELYEHAIRKSDQTAAQRLYASVEDGLLEAADDLEPGSVFLHALNRRGRNDGVRYSLFLGTDGPLTEKSLANIRAKVQCLSDHSRVVQFLGPKLDETLADLKEVVRGEGDGAVAVSRGRLDGVPDTEVLEFDHLAITRTPRTDGELALRRGILGRLAGKGE